MLKIENISKIYKTNDIDVNALKNVSFDLPKTGLIFITGKSGSGKSTLLNILGKLDEFDEGDIIIEGRSMKSFTENDADNYRNSYVGFVFQEFNLIEEYNVYKNISLGLNLKKEKTSDEKIKEILKKIELENLQNRKTNQLSGGERQRVAIARTLIKNPKILLCDEPTGNLDSETSNTIFQLLKEISKTNLVVVVTHDKEAAFKWGERIIEIKDGKIVSDTNCDYQNEKQPNDNLILEKYQLSNEFVFSFAINALKRRPIRLCITLLLSLIALCFFCISDSIASYNKEKVIINSMYDTDSNALLLYKNLNAVNDDGLVINHRKANMKDKDIEILNGKLGNSSFDIIYSLGSSASFYNSIARPIQNELYYNNATYGFMEMDDNFSERYNYQLFGNIPKADDEIVITKYAYEIYKEYGYIDENDNVSQINQVEDLIGKKIKIHHYSHWLDEYNFKITGIIDTKFNYNRYEYLLSDKALNEKNIMDSYNLRDELKISLENNLHGLVYFRKGFYQDLIYHKSSVAYQTDEDFFDVELLPSEGLSTVRNYETLMVPSNISSFKIYGIKEDVTKLENNQVVLPMFNLNGWNQLEYIVREKIIQYVEENFETLDLPFSVESEYRDYIINNPVNEYDKANSYQNFYDIEVQKLIDQYLNTYVSSKLSYHGSYFSTSDEILDVEVVGFYDQSKYFDNNTLLVSKQSLDDFKEDKYYIGDYKAISIPLTGKLKKDLNTLNIKKTHFDENIKIDNGFISNYAKFDIDNEITYLLEDVERDLSTMISIFKYISLGAMFFVIIFICYYFSGVILDKQKEIGILRALGASKKDILKIFITDSLLISTFVFAISLILSFIMIAVVNSYIIMELNFLSSIFMVTLRQILFLILIEIGVSALGIIIPLINLMRKKPIDIITNR